MKRNKMYTNQEEAEEQLNAFLRRSSYSIFSFFLSFLYRKKLERVKTIHKKSKIDLMVICEESCSLNAFINKKAPIRINKIPIKVRSK